MRYAVFVLALVVASFGQTSITIKPRNAAITSRQTQQYTASSPANWFVDGVAGGNATVGTITPGGLYTPPATNGAHVVKAVSTTNASVSATANIYVENLPGVFTFHYDNTRQGRNTAEIALQPSNVKSSTFGKLFSRAVDNVIYGQPLYVAGVTVPGKGMFNVVYVATASSSVYAFDADGKATTALWKRNFTGSPAGATPASNSIISTPVIDPSSNTMFVVAKMIENSVSTIRLHALDITTGADKFGGPVLVTASVPGTGDGSVNGAIKFNATTQHCRAALMLLSGNVYLAFASPGDVNPYHGWVFTYSASTLARTGVFNTTRNGKAGGIWQGAAGVSSDGTNVYVATGNGTFDATATPVDFGQSVLKLTPALSLVDFFTATNWSALNSVDQDVGGGGPMIPPTAVNTTRPHLLIVGSKRGDIYVINRDSLGNFLSGGSTANLIEFLPRALGQSTSTDQFFGDGAYWNGSVYFMGNFDKLKQFRLLNGMLSTSPIAQSSTVISGSKASQPTISSNGLSANGIVWVIDTTNVISNTIPGVLRAYNALNVGTQLYNSSQAGSRDTMGPAVKFSSVVVANGKVFVQCKNQLTVYGLLP